MDPSDPSEAIQRMCARHRRGDRHPSGRAAQLSTWANRLSRDSGPALVAASSLPRLRRFDRLVTAFRVTSTEPRSVQQLTLYALDSPRAEERASHLDNADGEPGYGCYGSSRVDGARLVMSWTWDSPVLRLPRGFGVRLHGNRKLVLQIHYNPVATGLDVPTRTRVELEFDDDVREASLFDVAPAALRLDPGMTRVEASAEVTVPDALTLLGVAPRMHSLGKTMELDRVGRQREECLANFDHWDFYKQRLFEYVRPVFLRSGDVLRISCVYNTQNRVAPTRAGERIDDEQCVAALLVAPTE